jgi:hypothetical protein
MLRILKAIPKMLVWKFHVLIESDICTVILWRLVSVIRQHVETWRWYKFFRTVLEPCLREKLLSLGHKTQQQQNDADGWDPKNVVGNHNLLAIINVTIQNSLATWHKNGAHTAAAAWQPEYKFCSNLATRESFASGSWKLINYQRESNESCTMLVITA